MPSHTCTKMAFFTADKKLSEFQNSCVLIKKKDLKITNIVIVTINIGNRTLSSHSGCNHTGDWTKLIGLPLRGCPILLIAQMITDRIKLNSVLFPSLIKLCLCFKFAGNLDDLSLIWDPDGRDLEIDLTSFQEGIKEWISDIRQRRWGIKFNNGYVWFI